MTTGTKTQKDEKPILVDDDDRAQAIAGCPYGQPGTKLWVKECFTTDHAAFYPNFPLIYRADGYDPLKDAGPDPDHPGQVWSPEQNAWYRFHWQPSIFCRREYSRIFRDGLHRFDPDVGHFERDAIAEGFGHDNMTAREAFQYLWGKINGEAEFGWDANPWVFVVSFRRVKP